MMTTQRLLYKAAKVGRNNLELIFWMISLVVLSTMNLDGSHFSLCPIAQLGFDFCPGCGLGHSIGYLFHGDLIASFDAHPLGIFALAMIVYRIIQLSKTHFKIKNLKQ